MKNVLIPTDFTADSLQLIHRAAVTLRGEKFNAVLFHAFNLPDDIVEMMFLSREKVYKGLITDEFRNQCRKLKNLHHEVINAINIKYMYGSSVRAFKNFAQANQIDSIVLPDHLQLVMPHKYSFNPVSILRKSGLKIINQFKPIHTTIWIPEQVRVDDTALVTKFINS